MASMIAGRIELIERSKKIGEQNQKMFEGRLRARL